MACKPLEQRVMLFLFLSVCFKLHPIVCVLMVHLYLFQVQFSESVPQTSHGEAVQERQLRAEEPLQNISSGKEI